MKHILFLISLSLFSFLLQAQVGLVSGELNVTTFPTNNGDGTFTLMGNFADPKGLYFAADVAIDMSLWKGNNYFRITAASANGSTLDLTVEDTYNIGFLGTGIYSIGQETNNLRLPGVSTTGDSNPALSTPPDYAAKFNFILTLIDQGIPGVDSGASVADTSTIVNPTDGDVLVSPDTLSFFDGNQWISIAINAQGAGLQQYEAAGVNGTVDQGAFVTATASGITYERTGGAGQNTEGILTVPTGIILQGVTVHFSSGQAPGNTFYLNVDYQNTGRAVNGGQDSVMPIWATVATRPVTFSDADPATNFIHSGTPLQIGIAQVDDNGTRTRIRYKITNYSQQVGSNASMLSIALP